MIAGMILAGGLARRMGGGDKPLLAVGGRPILARVIARMAPQVERLAVNANGDPARFSSFSLPVVPDGMADYPGPLAGILAGMDWAAAHGAEAVVTAAGDTPFLPHDLVRRLQDAAGGGLAIAAAADGWHPTVGLWPVGLRDDLRAAVIGGTRRVAAWAADQGCAVAPFPNAEAFFNVNTPADLVRAQAVAARE